MQLETAEFAFTFLTPCFSGTALGKDDDHAEMRVPPLRGHIRAWHRALFDVADANRVWGSTSGDEGRGSLVSIRLSSGSPPLESAKTEQLLPHKTKGQGQRPALPAETRVTFLLQRLPASSGEAWNHALQAVRTWLVAGTLGYRSNRAAGSVWPDADWTPANRQELARCLQPLLQHPRGRWSAALIGEGAGLSWLELRKAASDTPRGPGHLFGLAQPRTPSPTRFKVVRLDSGLCLLVLAPPGVSLEKAREALLSKPDSTRWRALGDWKPL